MAGEPVKRKIAAILLITTMTALCAGCTESAYNKYSFEFFGTFDTVVQVMGYAKTEGEFQKYADQAYARFNELNKLFDIYNDYEGIANIKTINDNAGKEPVEVSQEIINLILFAKQQYAATSDNVNIAMGPVLEIWHEYRESGMKDINHAQLPPMEDLKKAAQYTDIDKVIVDDEKNTVFLEDENMRLDVGAIAKGFATEIVADELESAGLVSALISSGGNVRAIGEPLDDRLRWGVGIQDPFKAIDGSQDVLLDIVFVTDMSVVSSGDYQRYYTVGGERIHHLIDPDTLMPASYFSAVTVMTEDSGWADFLSTAVFLMPYDEGRPFIESLDGVEALWVFPDGSIEATENMKSVMKILGGASSR